MKRSFALLLTIASALMASAAFAQDVKGDIKAGEQKIAMCIGCHGIKGYQASFPEVYRVPMIAGQNAKYLESALNAYKEGERKHPTMKSIAANLTPQEIADVAAFYAAQAGEATAPAKPSKEPSAKVAEILKKSACATCHGESYSKPISPDQPKIAGQHADYLYAALKAYKTEGNATTGRSNGVMAGIVKNLSLADLKALSSYIGSLEGDLKTVPQVKFHKAAAK